MRLRLSRSTNGAFITVVDRLVPSSFVNDPFLMAQFVVVNDVRHSIMMDDMGLCIVVDGFELFYPIVVAGGWDDLGVALSAGTCIRHDSCRTAGLSLSDCTAVFFIR